ncbi:RNA-directed DNA polymerase from mobile element jockey [Rhizoctonia solani]|uniref:RNA-directed DNA polymerase from mobile element jockey n=1 Tax=Rhizoctonia solani TaxID=456999 RepID=A0A0K6GGR3_9AGAM|nr:RNA-directed DNA polymerase from mobile element jockey [Rhizoctonia solani]
MMYNSSAAATRTTLVGFHTTTVPASNKSPELESITQPPPLVLALTRLLRNRADLTDLESEMLDRPYAKLAREAERVKAISSVNAEVNAGVGGMLNDESRILQGGNTHVPLVQTVAKNAVGSAKLANNVDADEACVLSTAFYGASLSRQFRAEPVQGSGYRCSHNLPGLYWREQVRGREPSQDPSPYQVRNRDRKDLDSEAPATFRCRHWIQGCDFPMLQYTIMGVKAAYHNLPERGAIDAAVKFTLLYSEKKVITKRLIHEAGSHNIIPHAQFGGRDITSCTDAGLCMIHDIKAQHLRKKAVTLLTLDVSGYFNNVDHSHLIYTMKRLGYTSQICNWLKSYLSHRTAQFCIDGTLCPHIQLPPVGIPQGSPLSPILSSLYSIPLLVTSADPQAHSFAYIDNFTILTYSKTHQENITILQDVTKRINEVAKCLGLEFEIPKSELIHFIRPRDSNVSNPSLTLSESGTDTVIKPQDCIWWLGFWLDRKLSFKEHIWNMANKAKAAISGLRMLANTQKGLTTRHARILFKAAIIPILTYGVPLWFHGHRQKSKLEPLRKVQNDGIQWLLGAFQTTPVPVMEHLASIPPFHITCHKLIDNIGAKLQSIPHLSELAKRLPAAWDSSDPTLPRSKDSPIAHIASTSHPDIKFVIPHLVHPSSTATPYPDNFTVKAIQKKDIAIEEHNEFSRAERSRAQPTLIGYSDRHVSVLNGCPKIGYGYTLHDHGLPSSTQKCSDLPNV